MLLLYLLFSKRKNLSFNFGFLTYFSKNLYGCKQCPAYPCGLCIHCKRALRKIGSVLVVFVKKKLTKKLQIIMFIIKESDFGKKKIILQGIDNCSFFFP